jgi:N-acetylglutamate synthase-like GNAT family acetyltransferase
MAAVQPVIGPARDGDLPEVLDLLRRSALTGDGLEQGLDCLLVARVGTAIMGCAAVERHGTDGLLRSVAVAARWGAA